MFGLEICEEIPTVETTLNIMQIKTKNIGIGHSMKCPNMISQLLSNIFMIKPIKKSIILDTVKELLS
jgi:hypothetical protein